MDTDDGGDAFGCEEVYNQTIEKLFFQIIIISMKKFIIFFLNLFIISNLSGQQLNVDSMKNLLNNAMNDSDRIKLLASIAELNQWSTPDTAIKYAMQAWQLALKSKDEGRLAQFPAAVLSEALSAKGNYSKALEIDLLAMQFVDEDSRWGNYFLIGNVYFYSENYAKALEYYLKVLKGSPKAKNSKVILGVTGEAYFHLGNLDSSYYFINKAYQIDKLTKGHWSVPYFYLGLIHSERNELQKALESYRSGLLYAKENRIYQDIVNGSNWIAAVFKQLNETDSAIYYSKQAIEIGQAHALNPGVMKASALLTELYLKINTDSAFRYQRMMLAIKDSLFSQQKIRQLENISFNEKMQQEEIRQNKIEYQNKIKIYGLTSIIIFFLILAFILYRNNRHKQKAFALLQRQKHEIDFQKAEVEKTLEQLKSTQAQLIQSEKMASLGELTAGIAHEIQNPLNFVNNFSDINSELVDELKSDLANGNIQDANEIADDIKENSQKISHHGKRADSIVKGMLQHSRTSTGQKELTDINALCDEYLRLAYHGMRAKDKSFNCTLETELDPSIPKINVVPQDIGRVLLNLINNALFTVGDKSKQHLSGYEPTVTIRTKNSGDSIEITVKDNGNGIPEKIKDEIFQPFFTTKPTGQGTGLGLSLSYDIVKAHGGEIKANSKEGEGTAFVVRLLV